VICLRHADHTDQTDGCSRRTPDSFRILMQALQLKRAQFERVCVRLNAHCILTVGLCCGKLLRNTTSS